MISLKTQGVALALALCSSAGAAQDGASGALGSGDAPPIQRDQVARIAQAYHEAGIFDGVLVVASPQGIIYSGAFGRANVEFDVPYVDSTRVRLASVSKPFTAGIILRMEEEGLLATTHTVAQLLPEMADAPFAQVTVDQLLRHSSGIANYQYKPPYQAVQSRVLLAGMGSIPVTLDDMIGTFAREPLSFEPGTQYAYSNANYILLQAIVERVGGASFADSLRSYVTEPLGLKDTGTLGFRSVIERLAQGYVAKPGGFEAPLQGNFVGVPAPGGVYSTGRDMAQWFGALFGGRFFRKAETLEKMTAPRSKAYSDTSFIAYGVFTSVVDAGEHTIQMIGHDGWGPPFTANLQYIPSRKLVIFAADGIGGFGGATHGETVRMAETIARASHGLPWDPPTRPADMQLAELIEANGVASGIAAFEAALGEPNATPRLEQELNGLGYVYLAMQAYEHSLAVFRLNVRLFPQSANGLDSLAEALHAAGRREEALEYYKKALNLQPDNSRLIEKVEELRNKPVDDPT